MFSWLIGTISYEYTYVNINIRIYFYMIKYPATDTNTGITTIASNVVYDTTAAESSASRLNLVASMVVIAALEDEQAIRHETAILWSNLNNRHKPIARSGESSILIRIAAWTQPFPMILRRSLPAR